MKNIVLLFVGVSALFEMAGQAMAQGALAATRGITNFGKINDRLYRGAQPESLGIQSLARLGVRMIVNLRLTNDVWSAEAAQARAVGILYTNVPMSGLGRPNDRQVMKVLSLLDNAPGPVFIHCQHGADRTGTIIACYRIKHDHWTSGQALGEAKRYGMSVWEVGMHDYVIDFAKSHNTD